MNKKLKILSSTLCAVLLSSGIAVTDAFASTAKSNLPTSTNVNRSLDNNCRFVILDQFYVNNLCVCLGYHPTKEQFHYFLTANDIMTKEQAEIFEETLYNMSPEEVKSIADGGALILKKCNNTVYIYKH